MRAARAAHGDATRNCGDQPVDTGRQCLDDAEPGQVVEEAGNAIRELRPEDGKLDLRFRLGDQANILVTDNQVRNFKNYSPEELATHVLMTWGDYVAREETATVPALGKTFPRAPGPL